MKLKRGLNELELGDSKWQNSLNCQQSKSEELNVMIAIAMYLQEIELVKSITTILLKDTRNG